jgi:putative DNA primase/helicase
VRGIHHAGREIIGTPETCFIQRPQFCRCRVYRGRNLESWRNSVARLAYGNYAMMTGIAAHWQRR